MSMTSEKVLVPAAEDMDDDTFAKHMSLRHGDSLGGLRNISFSLYNHGLATAWRAFHGRLTRLRLDLDHEHAEPEDR